MIRFAHAFRTPATPGDLAALREPPLLPRRIRVAVVAAAVAFPVGCSLGCTAPGTATGLPAPRDVSPVASTVHAPAAPARPLCVAGAGRCDEDRPEVCRGEGADAAWWPVMVQGRPLACRDHGALCSVEPDGMAVCVVTGDSQ